MFDGQGSFNKNPAYITPFEQIPFEGFIPSIGTPQPPPPIPLPSPQAQAIADQWFEYTITTTVQIITLPQHNHMVVQNTGGQTIRVASNLVDSAGVPWLDSNVTHVYDQHTNTKLYLFVSVGTTQLRIKIW